MSLKIGTLSLDEGMQYVLIRPGDADTVLQAAHFPMQRPLRPLHVEFLYDAITRGTFDQHTVIKIATLGGVPFLMDGQHRLNAVKERKQAQHFWVLVIPCQTQEEVKDIYVHTDINRPRTVTDTLRATNLAEELGVATWIVNKGIMGIRMIDQGFEAARLRRGGVDRDRLIERLRQWAAELRLYDKATFGANKAIWRALRNQPCVATCMVTLRWAPQHAFRFWTELAAADGLMSGTPLHTLFSFLATATTRDEDEVIYARRIALCWNAYVSGMKLTRTSIRNPDRPIEIACTPASGERQVTYELLTNRPSDWKEDCYERYRQESKLQSE